MLLPQNNTVDIQEFYPPIYRNKLTESGDMIALANVIIYNLAKKIEKRLKRFTFTEGVDTDYAVRLLKTIHVDYDDGVLNFMNAKNAPYTLERLKKNLISGFGWEEEQIECREENYVITVQYHTQGDMEKYLWARKYIPFLKSYLPLLFPPYYSFVLNIIYANTLENFAGKTIQELSDRTIESLETILFAEKEKEHGNNH